jgi:polyhydroxyalkanoate synthesis repressor PhaR
MTKKNEAPVVIKKYANRRLYNTETSVYITLDELREMVKGGRSFIVQDAKTGEDLTRQALAQIIFEQETKGIAMLPTEFLRNIISFYDDSMGEVLQHYLTASMSTFMNNQEKMKKYVGGAMKDFSPMGQFEELSRQNMAFFEKAMSAFSPFGSYFKDGKK